MSTPLIADGAYQIFNVKYPNSGVDLIHGNPLGQISGYVDNDDSINRKWKLWNFGSDGNQIILESMAASGSYASAYLRSGEASIFGSANPTVWTVRSVGQEKFQLLTADCQYVWILPLSENFATISLTPASDNEGTDAQWTFRPIVG